jgi:hypothetical protein
LPAPKKKRRAPLAPRNPYVVAARRKRAGAMADRRKKRQSRGRARREALDEEG